MQFQQPLRISVISIFPESFTPVTDFGITSRALQQGLWLFDCVNPRDFAQNKHRRVDDRPYGGGPGMVMQAQPLRDAILEAKKRMANPEAKVIYMSPQGRRLTQKMATRFVDAVNPASVSLDFILLCGRYEGVDERLISRYVDLELSIGDYVLSGGELAAMVVIDTLVRLLPGACGHEASPEQDSFSEPMLDFEQFTRPEVFEGESVPSVLLSGDHQAIAEWRRQNALHRTRQRRPDLLSQVDDSDDKNAS